MDEADRFTYVSPEAATILGRPIREIVGRSVREVLPGSGYEELIGLLESCREDALPSRLEHGVPGSDRRFSITLLPLEGQVCVHLVDVTPARIAEDEWAQHERIDRALAEVSAHFVQAPQPDLDEVMMILGRAVGASRSYLFAIRNSGQKLDNTHEWCAPGVEPQISNLQDLDADLFPWWMERLRDGDIIQIDDVSTMRPEASAEREILEAQGIRSALVVPIGSRSGALEGFLGFDDTEKTRRWSSQDTRALRVVSEIISAELERRGAVDALRQSEERFRQLAENIPQVFWMTSIDKAEVIYVSPAHERVWGRQRASLTDHPQQWIEAIHPDDKDRVIAALPKQVQGTYDEEYRVVRPDGEIRWVRDRGFPVHDDTGRPYRVAGVAEDITDRKLRGEELQLLSSAIEHAGEGVIITDASGSIEYVNPAFEEITGYSRADVLGQNPRLLKSEKHDGAFYRQMWDTLLAGRAWRERFVNRRKDGELYTQDSVITPVHSEDGEITHFVAAFRDVTKELALEDQLRQAQKLEAVGRLAGGIAHDFNNVLTIITGRAQFALDDLDGDDALARDIGEILSAADRAQRLSQQLLAFSRQQVTRPEVLEVASVARDARTMLRRLLGEHLSLDLSLSPDLGRIKADRTQIEQVLFNLAINARDAMSDGGVLTIVAENVQVSKDDSDGFPDPVQGGEYVRVRVSDTGTGMDDETLEHAFDPFFTTKPRGIGTGLGLSTVYGIVRQSGGSIRVASEPGAGTTFDLYLPRTDEALKDGRRNDARRVRPEPAARNRRSATILVVEDQPGVRAMVRRSLERAGYRVLEAEHGLDALDVCAREPEIDLMVTDMVMPVMGGRELGQKVREEHPNIRILFMSGYAAPDGLEPAVLAEDTRLIEKPFGPEALQRKVREVLEEAEDGVPE